LKAHRPRDITREAVSAGAVSGYELDAGERLDVLGLQSEQLNEPFGEMSGGAQEQISLLTRIGLAEVLAADGTLPLVLDDALVNTIRSGFAGFSGCCSVRLTPCRSSCQLSRRVVDRSGRGIRASIRAQAPLGCNACVARLLARSTPGADSERAMPAQKEAV